MTSKTLTAAVLAVAGATLATAALAERGGPQGGRMMMPDPAALFEKIDADRDGKVTEAEIAAWRTARVQGLDADADGRISAAEMEASMASMGAPDAAAMAARRIASRDSDGDGLLTAAELAVPPMPERMFARIDRNDDGAVTLEEAQAARERMGRMMRERGEHGGGRAAPAQGSN